MTLPLFTTQEAQEQAVFKALMWALSRPGEAQPLGVQTEALSAVGRTLLDLETSFYTSDPALYQTFRRLGARAEVPERAAYQFFPQVDRSGLEAIGKAPIGSLLHPEQAATLVVVSASQALRLRLRGPGIQNSRELKLGLPAELWSLREERVAYPLGWDLFVLEPPYVVGIPRTTRVEVV
jgi:alpha-D-ribose 1-methylphosphonate 5-triphosphate synthase subunit PhnH